MKSRRSSLLRVLELAACVCLVVSLGPAVGEAVGDTVRVSVDSAGTQAIGGGSYSTSVSADGRYVAFESDATNLVVGDGNDSSDVFVSDRETGTTSRVSVDTTGTEMNDESFDPSISGDGRYVAFWSWAKTLVEGDTNNYPDVFVRDCQNNITTRVSVGTGDRQATGGQSTGPSISADGRYVAFDSAAKNLVDDDTNERSDVFVHDRQTGATTRVSVDSAGTQAIGGDSSGASISADGRYVAFYSTATNLVDDDINGTYSDVFVHDRQTGATTLASVDSSGTQDIGGHSQFPSISGDGRYVVFTSRASNLVGGDTNAAADILLHDRTTGATTRVSVDSDGAQAIGGESLGRPAISADGRYVAFQSLATNLVSGDGNGVSDVFVRDRQAGVTIRASVDSGGERSDRWRERISVALR